ncbi:MAG: hypothetical protein F8N37_13900 [Telmatospirillum sp.]|nr:hypothetical protein [Telmatospirillum sp.]
MSILTVPAGSTYADYRNQPFPTDGTNAFEIDGNDSGDTIYGTKYWDMLHGGTGNDYLDGYMGGGVVFGFASTVPLGSNPQYFAGNDTLIGGEDPNATNTIQGAAGNDRLVAYYGTNIMWGGNGNNNYYQFDATANKSTINQSIDSNVNGTNSIFFQNTVSTNLDYAWHGNDLWLFSASDLQNQHGVVITNQGLGGLYTIDFVYGSDGKGYNISGLRPPPATTPGVTASSAAAVVGGDLSGALPLLQSSAALSDSQGMLSDMISHGTVANAARIAAAAGRADAHAFGDTSGGWTGRSAHALVA